MPDSTNALIEVIEDLVPEALFAEACGVCAGKTWYFGNRSNHEHDIPFWKMDLDGVSVFDNIWHTIKPKCEALTGCKLRVTRQYANGHTYGLGGQPYLDDDRPNTFTLLYYPMLEWKPLWQGETVFHDVTGEIAVTVTPRPNRAVLFNARIPHAGRAPSRSCPELRVTVAYKLEAVPEDEISINIPEQLADLEAESKTIGKPYQIAETSREGYERSYSILTSTSHVAELVREKLLGIGGNLRIPGYRPGKIPFELLETRYGVKARKEVIERVFVDASEEIRISGGLISSYCLVDGAEAGELIFNFTVTHLADLPEPKASEWSLEKLLAASPEDDAVCALLEQMFRAQVLDFLNAEYPFTIAEPLVDKELSVIIKGLPDLPADVDKEEILVELRGLAERRVRLGAVVIELAKRRSLNATHQVSLEQAVINWLISSAQVNVRIATDLDLAESS